MPVPSFWSRPLLWTVGLTLIVAEGLAFWLLCDHQVDRAQARREQAQAVQMAFGDCLVYVERSTIASCRRQVMGGR